MERYTAQTDSFARDRLPPAAELPEFRFDLPELEFPERLNAATLLIDRQAAGGQAERPALYSLDDTWTYTDLLEQANRIARVLTADFGIEPGKRVLLRSPNNPMLAACWLAVLKTGAIAVATMPLLRARDLEPVIDKAQCTLALCDARLRDELLAAEHGGSLERICWFNGDGGADDLEPRMRGRPATFDNVDTASDDIALIAFTSGTTGAPKGTVHFHRDVMAMCLGFGTRVLRPRPDDIFIGSPPLAFTYGLGMLLAFPLYAGAATVLLEQAPPAELAAAIERFRATICATAPTGYRKILTEIGTHDLSSLRQCVSAGEHLPLPTFQAWHEATGIKLIDGLGATEMIHVFVTSSGDDTRPGATGRAVPGYEVAVLDENGVPLPPGETGRLAVKGPTGCRYLDDPRQQDYVQHGWNVTGDLCRMDEDGYVWYLGRGDDMIISAGYNISGPEVEAALLGHPAVSECAVVGASDAERGTIVKAFVVVDRSRKASDELAGELKDFVKQRIAPYKYPRAIEFVDALPLTKTGKIQRFKLRS